MADILMPRLSDTMEEGTVARWLKHPGDPIAKGEVIAEIETDKATMDLEAYEEGTLQRLLVEEGSTVPIGSPIAVIGADAAAPARPATSSVQLPTPEPIQQSTGHVTPAAPKAGSSASAEGPMGPISSPLARSLAHQHGLTMTDITGTGPGGRVIRADVEAAIAEQAGHTPVAPTPAHRSAGAAEPVPPEITARPAPPGSADEVDEIPLTTVRRLTAERLTESAQAPHFYLTSVVDAQALLALRAEANQHLGREATKITVTDLLVKACANLLRVHPEINASWGDNKLLRYRYVHIGIAVAVPDGLVVPVIHHADRKTLAEIATEAHALADAARQGKLALDQITGGTFTISNLGMYGIDHFTAIINPPQAAILAVGAATAAPIVRDGQIVAGTTMKITMSIDHRVMDGATAAAFLAQLRDTLEKPLRILI